MKKTKKEKRDQRIVMALTPTMRKYWVDYAQDKHWTITTLIELAVQDYINKDRMR
jgi:hypothetical protein